MEKRKEDGIVYIGNKPIKVYVDFILNKFVGDKVKELKIVAGGNSIPNAIMVSEIVRERYKDNEHFLNSEVLIKKEKIKKEFNGRKFEEDKSAIEIVLRDGK